MREGERIEEVGNRIRKRRGNCLCWDGMIPSRMDVIIPSPSCVGVRKHCIFETSKRERKVRFEMKKKLYPHSTKDFSTFLFFLLSQSWGAKISEAERVKGERGGGRKCRMKQMGSIFFPACVFSVPTAPPPPTRILWAMIIAKKSFPVFSCKTVLPIVPEKKYKCAMLFSTRFRKRFRLKSRTTHRRPLASNVYFWDNSSCDTRF